ncbi:SRPBCC family protein [Dictyobacter aurantiacus]|uniref:Coenzyme Q-binding protein COQ10 START domain-containing protein n=1 Tax=Dictyobacter aurantiacus TaxID=1936993 RepID=A0A401ZFU0_9CHLR|nr:SRPBCC family protein [Dictyobacter aurantiacus]GCE05737.1 hypothetical protein KDAU_30660 [Dictyobacter aurantiacus]
MVEHSASVIVKAPLHQVYELFTHFNDFPKFMSFVKEVTYYDDRRSHWAVKVVGQYEWDAVNEDWIPDQQVGWRSTRGLKNSGRVKFRALGPERTSVDVYIRYTPPTGPLGELGDRFGVNSYFDSILKKDLNNFARMVEEAPAGALDPMSSHYLFHPESAVHRGELTPRQKAAMERDPMMSPQALAERQAQIAREAEQRRRLKEEQEAELKRRRDHERQLQSEREIILAREAQKRQQERLEREAALRKAATTPLDPIHTYAARAHGLGDRDGRVRDPNWLQDPMTARRRSDKPEISSPPPTAQ